MSKELIVRIIVSLVAFVNAACAAFGIAPLEVDEETVYTVVSFVFMFGTWVWGFWKNNDMTNAAQAGSAVTHAMLPYLWRIRLRFYLKSYDLRLLLYSSVHNRHT